VKSIGAISSERTITFTHFVAPQTAYPPKTFPPAVGL